MVKLENSDFQKKLDPEVRSRNEASSLSEKLEGVNPLMIKPPRKQHPNLKTTNFMSTVPCVKHFREYQGRNKRLSTSHSGTTKRSAWI